MWSAYAAVRDEIMLNHALMHWFSIIVMLALIAGIILVENRPSVLSIFLPLLGVAWAAAMVRFDFLIHRQGAYLRSLEAALSQQGGGPMLWETWKHNLHTQVVLLPILDLLAALPIIAATAFLALRPATAYLAANALPGARAYPWAIISVQLALLVLLFIIPSIAGR